MLGFLLRIIQRSHVHLVIDYLTLNILLQPALDVPGGPRVEMMPDLVQIIVEVLLVVMLPPFIVPFPDELECLHKVFSLLVGL